MPLRTLDEIEAYYARRRKANKLALLAIPFGALLIIGSVVLFSPPWWFAFGCGVFGFALHEAARVAILAWLERSA